MQQQQQQQQLQENHDDYAGFVIRLIEAVRERRHLYDKKHVSYFNRIEREKAWRELAELLGQSVDECQKRWKLLREKLFKELIKRDRIVTSGEEFHSDWACFERMSFIEHHISVRKKLERFAPYQLDGTTPDGQEAIQNGDDGVANITPPPVTKRSQRQHAISYKRLFANSQIAALTADEDSNESSIKDEPTDLLELEQHFEDSTQKDDVLEHRQAKQIIQEEPVQMPNALKVKSFAKIPEVTDDTDIIFGKLVTAMLKDIPSEAFRDDAKLQVMQLLIHAKRNAIKVLGNAN